MHEWSPVQNLTILEASGSSRSSFESEEVPYKHSDAPSTNVVHKADYKDEELFGPRLSSPDANGNGKASVWKRYLFDRKPLGILVNYAAIGLFVGFFQAIYYPYLKIFLNMSETEADAAETWMALPWHLKFFFALLTDLFPIRYYRRRPYIIAGWSLCLLYAIIMAALPAPSPYYSNGAVMNGNSADAGRGYISLFVLTRFALVVIQVAVDGQLVSFHWKQEQSLDRNKVLFFGDLTVAAYCLNYACQALSSFLVAFLCSSEAYGGDFGWGASISAMMTIPLIAGIAAISLSWFFVTEDQMDASDGSRVSRLQALRHDRAVWQVAAYAFLSRLCFLYYASTAKAIYEFWAPVGQLVNGVFDFINNIVYAVAGLFMLRLLSTSFSWRKMVLIALTGSLVFTVFPPLFTVYGVVRNEWFSLIWEQCAALFEAIGYYIVLVSAISASDVERGLESTSFNAVLTAANIALPFAVSLSQSIGAHFDVYDTDYEADTSESHSKVLMCFIIVVVVRVLHVPMLLALPKDGFDGIQDMKFNVEGSEQSVYQMWKRRCVLIVLGFAVFWAILTTCLAATQNTSCLTVAGGEGC